MSFQTDAGYFDLQIHSYIDLTRYIYFFNKFVDHFFIKVFERRMF